MRLNCYLSVGIPIEQNFNCRLVARIHCIMQRCLPCAQAQALSRAQTSAYPSGQHTRQSSMGRWPSQTHLRLSECQT